MLWLLLSLLLPAHAISLREKRSELRYLQQHLRVGQERLKAIRQQESSATMELSQIQQNLEVTTTRLHDNQYRYFLAKRKVTETARALEGATSRISQQQRYAKLRLRNLWKYRQMDNVALLLTASDLSAFIQRLQFLEYVTIQDARLIQDLLRQRQQIARLQRQHVQRQQEIAAISKSIAQQKEQLAVHQTVQSGYVEQLRQHRWMVEREVRRMEEASREIERLIRRLTWSWRTRYRPRYGGGRLLWPLPGHLDISSTFGWRNHPLFGVRMYHAGIDIPAEASTPIHAAHNGEVLFSGWYGGYGKVVIIDHGGGIATLYGHTSSYWVEAGQKVKKGQAIAAVGSTGFSTGPHLHFEVRRDGTPVDPLPWL